MIASTWLDLVVGIDVHFEMVLTRGTGGGVDARRRWAPGASAHVARPRRARRLCLALRLQRARGPGPRHGARRRRHGEDDAFGRRTSYISTGETPAAIDRFKSGSGGLAKIDVPTLLKTGSGVVDHSNVMQALDREGASAFAKKNVTTAARCVC